MDRQSLRALLILGGAYVLAFVIFSTVGLPGAGSGGPRFSPILAALAAGSYALTSLAAIVFARAVLGLFIDFSRPVAFFRVLGALTDPFVALFRPITPGFLEPAFHHFYAAFCLYFVKLLIFGALGAPPPWLLLLVLLG